MKKTNDKQIINSWKINAKPWIRAIENGQIHSRITTTNQAIVDTITAIPRKTVIDIGCGEGWLMRELASLGFLVSGLDAVPELIEKAKQSISGNFYTLAYEEISKQTVPETFDIAVCNFSLIGKEATAHVIRTLPCLLNPSGHLIIQTLHPVTTCSDQAYSDGWRKGSWAGFSNEFSAPSPWYFRTIESWFTLLKDSNYQLISYREPKDPKTTEPASLILVAQSLA